MIETRARWRFRLPHWEVAGRAHFVTIRCAGSLPVEALVRVREVHEALQIIEPASQEFLRLQRKYFLICEQYLDAGHGFCPFKDATICKFIITTFDELPSRSAWHVEHFTLMPNHVHLLLRPNAGAKALQSTIRGWKWYVAKETNRLLGREGAFWQSDWFDRWARNESEEIRMRDYIRQNAVKAALAGRWEEHPWCR